MHTFEAGKGINALKINENFTEVMDLANANETALLGIEQTALRKDGTNLTQEIVDDFKKDEPIVLNNAGDILLTDNRSHFLTLTGNGAIVLPTVLTDQFSHTITLVVQPTEFSLTLDKSQSAGILGTNTEIIETDPFSVLYVYNKIDKKWYYYISQ
jgi:hypothetical protein